MEIVRRRNRATLTNILNAKLAVNSVIHSDEWRGNQKLPQHVPACILYNTANHTYNFVDPNTGAHTQVSLRRCQVLVKVFKSIVFSVTIDLLLAVWKI